MDKKTNRFELLLSDKELQALDRLVKNDGMRYRAEWLAGQIQRAAKRKKVWT